MPIFYPSEHPALVGGESIHAIVPLGFQPIIDIQVPDLWNYKAGGVYHHNCGKSISAAHEVAYHATGLYPDWWEGRRFDPLALNRPLLIWISGETAEATRDTAQKQLFGDPGDLGTGAIPLHLIGEHRPAAGTADLLDYVRVRHEPSGTWTLIRIKYYAQGRRKWQGPKVDLVWFDEEPPEDIYNEGLARTIASGGCAMLTFTPLLGASNVVLRFLGDEGVEHPDRGDTNMTIEDAIHIPESERQKIIDSFPPHEREARAKGIPTMGSGRVFPVEEDLIAFDPGMRMPEIWPRLVGMDFGWDHPTAAVWGAWDRDTDTVYIYDAYRVREAPVAVHSTAIRAKGQWIPVSWPADGYQHEKGTGRALAEQYRTAGVNMLPTHAQYPRTTDQNETSVVSVEAGVADMLERMITGRFKVARHLNVFWDEFRLYHRLDGKLVKERDDVISACRYLLMMLRHAQTPPVKRRTVSTYVMDPQVGY